MKKVFMILTSLFMFFGLVACDKDQISQGSSQISNNQVYFFYQNTCGHCHNAAQYIRQRHPGLKMVNVDVRTPEGFNLFLKCAQKFNLNQNSLGTPLICMGSHYIMGWSDEDANRFDSYVQRFK